MENTKQTSKISQEITNLVIARLETIPPKVEISIGGGGNFTIQELIERVKKQDDIGIKMIDMQLNYLRSLKRLSAGEFPNASFTN